MFVIVLCQVIYQKQMQEDTEETVKTVLGENNGWKYGIA